MLSQDDTDSRPLPLLRYFIISTGALFLLIAAFYLAENLGGQRAWEREKARLAAAGESLDPDDFFPDPKSVPDDENGATLPIFAEIFSRAATTSSRFDPNAAFDPSLFLRAEKGSSTHGIAPDFAALAKAVIHQPPTGLPPTDPGTPRRLVEAFAPYESDIAKIEEALDRPHFIAPTRQNSPLEFTSYHLTVVTNYTQMASLRASCRIAAGDHAAALHDIESVLRALKLTSDPTLLSFLVSMTTVPIGIRSLWFGLSQQAWTSSELMQLDAELASIHLNERLIHCLRGERAIFCATLDAYEADRRLATDGLRGLARLWPSSKFLPVDFDEFAQRTAIQIAPKGWFQQNQVTCVKDTEHYIHSLTSRPYGLPPSISRAKTNPYTWYADQVIWTLSLICVKARHADAILAQARTAIAIEMFRQSSGHLPDSLNELSPSPPPDPMTGAHLRYQRVDDTRYKLWSVAFNGVDDGGEIGPSESTKGALDWVWQSWISETSGKTSE